MSTTEEDFTRRISALRAFQYEHVIPVSDISRQNPKEALHSLREATWNSPEAYRGYLSEAVDCYENHCYRAAVLMVWSAVMEHLYRVAENHPSGLRKLEAANKSRFGNSKSYKEITKGNDLLYIADSSFLHLGEDSGLFNKNARLLLTERLNLRNRCGHPTGYVVGREETVIFIESLINNILNGAMVNWGSAKLHRSAP